MKECLVYYRLIYPGYRLLDSMQHAVFTCTDLNVMTVTLNLGLFWAGLPRCTAGAPAGRRGWLPQRPAHGVSGAGARSVVQGGRVLLPQCGAHPAPVAGTFFAAPLHS